MISLTAEYALRAIVYLAGTNGSLTSRRDIAEATRVPNDYLMKVMQELDRAGIVLSQRGPGGGYRLAVLPDEVTVYEVVSAIAALPRIKKCPLGIEEHIKLCPLHKRLDDAAALVERAFRETTIAELVPGTSGKSTCRFPREL